MATQPISMNIIKQVLIRLSQKESVRKIATTLHISKNTVSRYKALSEADPMSTRDLIALEDTVLNHRFNGGNPAYYDTPVFQTRGSWFLSLEQAGNASPILLLG